MKKIPAARPAIDEVIPSSASIPPGMAKLILTLSIKEIMQAINIGVITRNQRAFGILLSIVNTSAIAFILQVADALAAFVQLELFWVYTGNLYQENNY